MNESRDVSIFIYIYHTGVEQKVKHTREKLTLTTIKQKKNKNPIQIVPLTILYDAVLVHD